MFCPTSQKLLSCYSDAQSNEKLLPLEKAFPVPLLSSADRTDAHSRYQGGGPGRRFQELAIVLAGIPQIPQRLPYFFNACYLADSWRIQGGHLNTALRKNGVPGFFPARKIHGPAFTQAPR